MSDVKLTERVETRPITLRRIKAVVDQIVSRFAPRKVILFGSRATGKARPDSDVDLLVITDEPSDCDSAATICRAIQYDFPLDLLVSDERRLTERMRAGDWLLIDAVKQGRVLYDRSSR